jgi:cation diffusion facilitator family transporter
MLVSLLLNRFVRDKDNAASPEVRRAYGEVCGFTGITLNALLFAGKLSAGFLSGSIAVTADAFNNLSDAASSLVTLLGFRIGSKKPDIKHPYGHARMEYVSGLIVAVMILFMAFELIRSSVSKLTAPEPVVTSPLIIIILAVSIGIKIYMSLYNRLYGKRISSEAMLATADDARNDVLATSAVLLANLFSKTAVWLDGACGLLVGLFILYSGIKTTSGTISTILGKPPEKEYINKIASLALAHEGILGVHDIIVHDYGPGNKMISLHAEVTAQKSVMELHELIDIIENEIDIKLDCQAVIHMDPIAEDDEATDKVRRLIKAIIYGMDPEIGLHDFRMTDGEASKPKITFDILVPFTCKLTDTELQCRITEAVKMTSSDCELVLRVDRGNYL